MTNSRKKHLKNVSAKQNDGKIEIKNIKPKPKMNVNIPFCEICQVSYSGPFAEHLLGNEHLEKMKVIHIDKEIEVRNINPDYKIDLKKRRQATKIDKNIKNKNIKPEPEIEKKQLTKIKAMQINKEIEVQNKNPQRIIGVEKLFCNICQLQCSCIRSLNDHLSGRKHLKKMKAVQINKEIEVQNKNSNSESDFKKIFCEICQDLYISQSLFNKHLSEIKHLRKMKALQINKEIEVENKNSEPEVDVETLFCYICKLKFKRKIEVQKKNPKLEFDIDKYFCKVCQDDCSLDNLLKKNLLATKYLKKGKGKKEPEVDIEKLFCNFCQLQCSSIRSLSDHLIGNKHFMKTQALQDNNKIEIEKNINPKPKVNDEKLFCEICQVSNSSNSELNKHLSGKKHLKRIKATQINKEIEDQNKNSKLEPDVEKIFSEICQVPFSSNHDLNKHLSGKKHLKKIKATQINKEIEVQNKNSKPEPEVEKIFCEVCQDTYSSNSLFNKHLSEIKHLEKMKDLQINKEIKVQNKNSEPEVGVEKLFCNICQVPLNSNSDLKDHLSGKKHLKKIKATQINKEINVQNKNSETEPKVEKIFCEVCQDTYSSNSLFNKHLSEIKHLEKMKPLQINKEIEVQNKNSEPEPEPDVEKIFCEICQDPFSSNILFNKHLSEIKHLRNMRALQINKEIEVENKKSKPEPDVEKIFCDICQDSYSSQSLFKKHLSEIKHLRNMRILQINKEIEVQNKNSKPVVVVEKLFCEICQVSCASSFNEHLSEEKHLSKMKHEFKNIVMNNLVENTSFTNYLALFLKTVGPSEEVFASYKQICFRFNRLFRNLFPMCTMQQIGSTLTSLCFNTNNLKIYVDKGKGIDLKLIKFFNKAKSVIFGNSNLFSDVKIHSKKLKIITFLDNKTNITCELHFSNAMSVYSSLLIKHYLSFDTRIKPLMMIIKYWAKQCGISGRFTSQKITSYALVMLVIFYLQQPNVNLVPPIITLKEICNPKIVDGWQVNFDKKIQHSSAKNESSIPELLYGFFNFYANFDFNEFVICPIDGCAHSKKSFKYIDNLPKCMDRYKKYITDTEDVLPLDIENLLCIQDPIELNNNCSDNVSKSFVKYFQRQASQAARIYKSSEIVKKKDDNKKSEINLKLLKDSRFCNSSEIVKKKDDNKKSRKINLKLLKPILKQDTTFDNILDAFINKVTLNDEAIEDLYQPICAKLNKLLRLSFPKSQTYRYGSTVSGLCFKNSDLDLCLNIGEPMNENDVSSEIWTFQEVFTEAYFLLKEKGSYKKILPIPKARVPIIKFIHKKEKISCDLSFNNSLSIYNSRLIKHYLTFDTRIKPLILIIKYWANLCELKITSYALVMLVIFFLQQPNINLVPSIITLNGKCNPEIVDGWQVNFDEKIQYSSAKNKSSIPELLYGFFNFYANFDFDNFVICPIDGCAHFKETFEDISKLPKSMNRYKEYMRNTKNAIPLTMKKIFCLQDPIALNANCTINFNNNFLKAFRNYFSTAEKVCVTALENNSSQLLINLFETITKKKNKRHCKIRNEN